MSEIFLNKKNYKKSYWLKLTWQKILSLKHFFFLSILVKIKESEAEKEHLIKLTRFAG